MLRGRSSTATCGSRDLAVRGHYPSIDPLQSVSRLLHDVASREQVQAATRLRALLAAYREAEDLINVGAYVKGSNPEIDLAVRCRPAIQKFLRQEITETAPLEATRGALLDLAKTFGKEA
jgi:flagellar biosynthesis/type III secretory pathway ATPase